MARDSIIIATCDPCDEDGKSNVQAVATHVIAANGKPAVEIDVCPADDRTIRWLLHVCEERGRPLPGKEARLARAAEKVQRKELERTTEESEQPAPARLEAPKKEKKRKQAKDENAEERVYLVCPESHRSQGGAPQRVSYRDRTSHVDQCHKGKRIWDIDWVYPKDREWFPCTVHAECMKTGLSFETVKGTKHHARIKDLPHIDLDDTPKEAE